jgi:2-amino-4-hydroxy-6-hydroxymethyldihydropteridine diphosphokinase
MNQQQVIFGLGSNLGDRAEYLRYAVTELRKAFGEVLCSGVYESAPLVAADAPEEWKLPFLNMAVAALTDDPPVSVLAIAKSIEQLLGREDRGRWAPREIDVDILALGSTVIKSRTLVIPHAELLKRDFALIPLAEVSPEWRFPQAGPMQGVAAKDIVKKLKLNEHAGLERTTLTVE